MRERIVSIRAKSLLLTLSLCILIALPVWMSVARAAENPQADFAAVDAFIEEQMARHNIPGLALAIVQDGEVAYVQGYGEADGQPVTPQSRFYIGSISKSFTALAVMQLAEAGAIDLDAPVQRYLPWFTVATDEYAEKITVRHLLHQTSGLSELGFRTPWASQPLEDAVRDLRRAQSLTPPGEAFHYFNANYQVLGLLVEQVSGLTYAEYMQQHVFEPLDMESSTAESGAAVIQGYGLMMGLPVPLSEPPLVHGVPSGYIVSTAADMAPYLITQLTGGVYGGERVLTEASIATLHTASGVAGSRYAMGWEADMWDDQRVIRHGGDLLTFHADAILLPDQETGIMLLVNQNNLLSSFFAWPSLSAGMVDLMVNQVPEPGLPVGLLSLVVAGIVVLSLVRDARTLIKLRGWTERLAQISRSGLIRDFMSHVVAVALPFLLPLLLSLLLAQTVTLRVMFAFLPDLTLLLILEAILAAFLLVMKGWLLIRYRGEMQSGVSAERNTVDA